MSAMKPPLFLLPYVLLTLLPAGAQQQVMPSSEQGSGSMTVDSGAKSSTGDQVVASASFTPAPLATPTPVEKTPLSLPSSTPFVFRKIGETELLLHVTKPAGWKASEKLPCLISFFGGGWVNGTPSHSIEWARWAAEHGIVGVAPDYRTRSRFNSQPEDSVSDARAAVRWVQEHASELGVDPSRIICSGGSAGGHVAAWTAIPAKGPGVDDPGAPSPLPVALILFNPVTDTKDSGYGGTKRFGGSSHRALACSVPDQMPAKMPPTIIFHAKADKTVPFKNSTDFLDKLVATGNRCELVSFEGLGHSYYSTKYGAEGAAAKVTTKQEMERFLVILGLLQATSSSTNSTPVPSVSPSFPTNK